MPLISFLFTQSKFERPKIEFRLIQHIINSLVNYMGHVPINSTHVNRLVYFYNNLDNIIQCKEDLRVA